MELLLSNMQHLIFCLFSPRGPRQDDTTLTFYLLWYHKESYFGYTRVSSLFLFQTAIIFPKMLWLPFPGIMRGVYYLPWLNGRLQHKNHWQLFNEASASSCRPQAEIWSKRNCTNCISVHLIVRRWYTFIAIRGNLIENILKLFPSIKMAI